jgi:hypothetical protein
LAGSPDTGYKERMKNHGPFLLPSVLAAALVVLATAGDSAAAPASLSTPSTPAAASLGVELAHNHDGEPRELQPRYESREPRGGNSYNDEYIFGLTRGIADSTMHPALKILVFPITVPLDFALLPFEVMAGIF